MCSRQICSNCVTQSCQYGPKPVRTVSNTLVLKAEGGPTFYEQLYLIKWPVGVISEFWDEIWNNWCCQAFCYSEHSRTDFGGSGRWWGVEWQTERCRPRDPSALSAKIPNPLCASEESCGSFTASFSITVEYDQGLTFGQKNRTSSSEPFI